MIWPKFTGELLLPKGLGPQSSGGKRTLVGREVWILGLRSLCRGFRHQLHSLEVGVKPDGLSGGASAPQGEPASRILNSRFTRSCGGGAFIFKASCLGWDPMATCSHTAPLSDPPGSLSIIAFGSGHPIPQLDLKRKGDGTLWARAPAVGQRNDGCRSSEQGTGLAPKGRPGASTKDMGHRRAWLS